MKIKLGEYEEELDFHGSYKMKDWKSKFEKAKEDVCVCLDSIDENKNERDYNIMIELFGCLCDIKFEDDTLIIPDYSVYYGMDVIFGKYFDCRIVQMGYLTKFMYNPLKNDDVVNFYLYNLESK